jgi:hypothetical protein
MYSEYMENTTTPHKIECLYGHKAYRFIVENDLMVRLAVPNAITQRHHHIDISRETALSFFHDAGYVLQYYSDSRDGRYSLVIYPDCKP